MLAPYAALDADANKHIYLYSNLGMDPSHTT